MSSKRGYRLLKEPGAGAEPEEEEAVGKEGDLESPQEQTEPSRPSFRIRILDTSGQEHQVELDSPSMTIAALKAKVAEVSSVPPPQQRLIFCGKMLPDTQTVEGCGLKNNHCVHLFARPAQTSLPSPAGGSQAGGRAGGLSSSRLAGPTTHLTGSGGSHHLAFYGDPELMRSVQSVKLFSSCLVAICTMQLLLLLLRLMSTWQDEDGAGSGGGTPTTDDPVPATPRYTTDQDDSALFFMQVLLNSCGIYVGLLGARSAHTLQAQAAKAYFYGLCMVGMLWITLRIVWAIRTVQAGYDTEVGPPPKPSSGGNSPAGGGGGADGDAGTQAVPKSELIYMVTLSVMVYVGLWSICWLRASQFHRAVVRASPPESAAVAATGAVAGGQATPLPT